MSERTQYVHGTPCWIDLGSPEPDASARFYGELFGWSASEPGPVEETGGYRNFELRGKMVAGLMQAQEGQPTAWSTYVSVDDADAAMQRAKDAGGTEIVEAMDVMSFGRMGYVADPAGAVVGIWQPRDFAGAELATETGAFGWNELTTRDPEGAQRFYGEVFGWSFEPVDMGGFDYIMFSADGAAQAGAGGPGDVVGGIMPMGDAFPPEMPPHWMTYFGVDDADASAAKAEQLGGTISVPPTDIPPGRFAIITDPQGAVFTIIKPVDEPPPELRG